MTEREENLLAVIGNMLDKQTQIIRLQFDLCAERFDRLLDRWEEPRKPLEILPRD